MGEPKWLDRCRLPAGVRYRPVKGTAELEVRYRGAALGVVWPEKGQGWKWAQDTSGASGVAATRNRAFEALCTAAGHDLTWGHVEGVPKPTLPPGYLLKPGALRVVDETEAVAGWVVALDIHGEQWVAASAWDDIPRALDGERYQSKEEATQALIGGAT